MLLRVFEIPKNAEPDEPLDGRIVLALGEVTGHAHALRACDARSFTLPQSIPLFEWQTNRFVQVPREATLVHEEHAPIHLPPGEYAVLIQREYRPQAVGYVTD